MKADAVTQEFYRWREVAAGAIAVQSSCLTCPPRSRRLSWRYNPHPGFGIVTFRKDGEVVASEVHERGLLAVMRRWRQTATDDPGHVWCIDIESQMAGYRYTRLSHREWVCTHTNPGFG